MPDYSQVQPYSMFTQAPKVPVADASAQAGWEQIAVSRKQRQLLDEQAAKKRKMQALVPIYTDANGNFDREGYLNALRMIDAEMAQRAETHFINKDKEQQAINEAIQTAEIRKQQLVASRIDQNIMEMAYVAELLDKAHEAYSQNDTIAGNAWYQEALRDAPLINTIDARGNTIQGIQLPKQYNPQLREIVRGKVDALKKMKQSILSDVVPKFAMLTGANDQQYIDAVKQQILSNDKLPDQMKNDLLLIAEKSPAVALSKATSVSLPAAQKAASMSVELEKKEREADIETAKAVKIAELRELKLRDIQANFPVLQGENAVKLANAAMGIEKLYLLKQKIDSGQYGFFNKSAAGEFIDPEAAIAFEVIKETYGRERSGAAINESEWKNFANQLMNTKALLTESGRKAISKNIDDFISKYVAAGVMMTGSDKWYSTYKAKTESAKQDFIEAQQSSKTEKSVDDYLSEVRKIKQESGLK